MLVQPGFNGGRDAYHIIIFADTGKRWICSMADCNVQETCSLTIFLSLRRIANARTALPLSRTPFSAMGAINHVNVFMNNKLIRFRTSCMYICAEACNPGSTQFNPLSTEPGSTRVVVRTRL